MKADKPYIDEQWNDLPLPDADKAWQRMELLLGDDKKRRRVLPFWFWRYGGIGLLVTALAIGGLLWLKADPEKTAPMDKQLPKQNDIASTPTPEKPVTDRILTKPSPSGTEPGVTSKPDSKGPQKGAHKQWSNKVLTTQKSTDAIPAIAKKKSIAKAKTKTAPQQQADDDPMVNNKQSSPQQTQQKPTANSLKEPAESMKIPSPPKDSVAKKDTAAEKAAEPVAAATDENKPKKKPAFEFSAGVGLQQAIALNSQGSSTFNYKGKRSTVSDLIPSVYLRLQKGKWFAQAEFQYAVPQPVEQFSFSQKTTYDAAALNVNTERISIQKLYYHQLPFSVNYRVLSNWSVGVGAMYNVLAGAVTEQEVHSKNVQTGIEATTRNLAPVKGYKDSFLYKTTAGILVQTDYQWKRFSLGMRFTQNLQPFIKYTRPDGAILDEKNSVLQAILRFRLF